MAGNSYGQTVAWGGSTSVNPLSFDSKGNQDINTLVWELGWFDDGYTPTAINYATWADKWNSVDVGSFFNYGTFYAANEVVDDPDASVYGKLMYTFVHNGGTADTAVWGDLMGTPDGEALLYTAGLTFPSVPGTTVSFNIANDPLNAADDDTFQLIWGRVDRNMYLDADWGGTNTAASPAPANGGVMQGGGIISIPMADSQVAPYADLNGLFENQTATWAATSAIPEPSVAVLSGLGMLLLMRRRRSN